MVSGCFQVANTCRCWERAGLEGIGAPSPLPRPHLVSLFTRLFICTHYSILYDKLAKERRKGRKEGRKEGREGGREEKKGKERKEKEKKKNM